jgi:hypothetical protein
MTAFELSLLIMGGGQAALGLIALAFGMWAVRYLGKIWTNHLQRLEKKQETALLELMRCNDRLVTILESLQNPDKT